MGALERGERKHETCRWGVFSGQAARVDMAGRETPLAMPLCAWSLPDEVPPALTRGWGGAIEFDRDCAVCLAHRPISGGGREL